MTTVTRHLLTAAMLAPALLGAQPSHSAPDDPEPASATLSLMGVPADAVAYHETKVRTRALVAEQKFAEAELLAVWLTNEYPRDGENWVLLGVAERGLQKHAEAAAAFETAGPLVGWETQHRSSPFNTGYNAAASHLAAGNRKAALDVLRTMVSERRSLRREALYGWPEFAALRDDPAFREITGQPNTAGWTRVEGWRRDIDHLRAAVKRVNPEYRARPFPAELERRYRALKASVPTLSDEQIFIGMGRMLAPLHQGHIALFPPPKNRHLPLQLYAFPEGIHVVAASPDHRDLIGARVTAIGRLSTDDALRRLAEARSVDGDMQHLWSASDLGSAFHLKGIGAIASLDSVSVTVQPAGGGSRVVTLATVATPIAPRMDKLQAPPGVEAPLFLRDVQQAHWELLLPEHQALYVQVNQVANDRDETLPAFGRRLRTVIDSARPANVILDVRHDNGGSDVLLKELIRTLAAYSQQPGTQLYVMIGRRTYSAAATLITELERLADPIFVGEASSECCNFHGVPSGVVLPYSRVTGELTTVRATSYLGNPWDGRREMSPSVPVQLTASDYFAGRDPALDAVLRIIAKGR